MIFVVELVSVLCVHLEGLNVVKVVVVADLQERVFSVAVSEELAFGLEWPPQYDGCTTSDGTLIISRAQLQGPSFG